MSVSARLVCYSHKPGEANCLYYAQADAGKMLIAGAAGDPVDSALFIWQDVSKQVKSSVYVGGPSSGVPEALS